MKKLVFKDTLERVLLINYSKFGQLIDFTTKSIKIVTTEGLEQSEDLIKKFREIIPDSVGFVISGFDGSKIINLTIEHPNYSFRVEPCCFYVVKGTWGWELC